MLLRWLVRACARVCVVSVIAVAGGLAATRSRNVQCLLLGHVISGGGWGAAKRRHFGDFLLEILLLKNLP